DRLKYWLQLARRVRDDLQHVRGRGLLLERPGEFLFQVGVGCAKTVNVSSRLRCLRTKTGNASAVLRPFASQDHLVGTVTRLSVLTESHDELAALCMSGKQHSERRRGFGHDRLPVATGSPQALRISNRE